jgi:hypothetical protein
MRFQNKSISFITLCSAALLMPLALSSCSLPNVKMISCKNDEIAANFKDGSTVLTPKSSTGSEDFTWYPDEKKIEVKVGLDQDKKQKVNAVVLGDVLRFKTSGDGLFSGKSFSINLKSKMYLSEDLNWQDSPDGPFKINVKGTCAI